MIIHEVVQKNIQGVFVEFRKTSSVLFWSGQYLEELDRHGNEKSRIKRKLREDHNTYTMRKHRSDGKLIIFSGGNNQN